MTSRKRKFGAAAALIMLTPLVLGAAPRSPANILFVGSCLTFMNQGVNWYLQNMVQAPGSHLTVSAMAYTMAGQSLVHLWKRNVSLQSSDDKSLFGLGRKFDVVVLQEQNAAFDPRSFQTHVRLFTTAIREQGGEPILFLPFPYVNPGEADMEALTAAHLQIAKELGIRIAPVGPAILTALKLRPQIELILGDSADPDILGTYLAACVIYATIFEESPEGNLFRGPFLESMPGETIAFLQETAWKVSRDFNR
jgi:hypothetical protein